MNIQPNTTIRDYTILSKLGEGGMGTVWLARDNNLERDVALKVLSPALMQDERLVERFRQEAKMQAQLVHSGIVALYNFFLEQDTFIMVMEYAKGFTLRDLIVKNGALSEQVAVPIFLQLLEAFSYAHSMGIVHRDIKPSNILIGGDGKVKVLDFGIGKVMGDKGLTKTGATMGTVFYMSPEQIRAVKDIDQRSDVYSLGITFYEALSGRLPFTQTTDSEFEIMQEIVQGKDLTQGLSHISEKVRAIIQTMAHPDREKRFSTCYAITQAFQDYGVVQVPKFEQQHHYQQPQNVAAQPSQQKVQSHQTATQFGLSLGVMKRYNFYYQVVRDTSKTKGIFGNLILTFSVILLFPVFPPLAAIPFVIHYNSLKSRATEYLMREIDPYPEKCEQLIKYKKIRI